MDRNTLIKMIHIGCRNLGWDTDTRHAWQQQLTGQHSLTKMNAAQLQQLVTALKTSGGLKRYRKKEPKPRARKIYALWCRLEQLGAIKDKTEHALGRYIHRMTGRHRAAWLTDEELNTVIQALKQWVKRVENQQEQH